MDIVQELLDAGFGRVLVLDGAECGCEGDTSLVLALWVLADLTMMDVLLFALRAMGREAFPGWKEEGMAFWAVLIGGILALTLFSGRSALRDWNRSIVPQMCLILALALPPVLWITLKKWSVK